METLVLWYVFADDTTEHEKKNLLTYHPSRNGWTDKGKLISVPLTCVTITKACS